MKGFWRHPTPMGSSIRHRLVAAFGALLLLGVLNTAVHEWGVQRRQKVFSDLQHALDRQAALVDAMEAVKDHHRQVRVLSGLVGLDTVVMSAAEQRHLESALDSISFYLAHAPATTAESDPVPLLHQTVLQLTASWKSFYEKQATEPAAAIAELATRADPLAEHLLQSDFPHAIDLEKARVHHASTLFVATDRTSTRLGWSIIALSAVFGVLLLVLSSRHLLRGLDVLRNGAERIGSGELSHRIVLPRRDELGKLARSFNHMAASLQTAHHQLEVRNAELSGTVQELQRAQEELIQSEKLSAMGAMLAGLAHELNNPLASVLGYSELIRGYLAELEDVHARAALDELAVPLVREALRARALVKNLLQFSRKSSTQVESVDLAGALDLAVSLRRYAYAQAGMRLEVRLPESPLYVHAEAQRLQQVFLNLINNALDALVEGRGSRLEVAAERAADGGVTLRFLDDGPGIREVERIFDPFYTTKPVGAGTGLGLTLAHRFLEEFGGTISACNVAGAGACFELNLQPASPPTPVDPVETGEGSESLPPFGTFVPATQRSGQAHRAANGAANGAGSCAPRPGPRILVVEDEEPIRQLHRRLLARLGAEVLMATTGEEGRRLLHTAEVDLVISDVRMPGELDGIRLHAWVCEHRAELKDRFLFVTGDVHDTVLAPIAAARPGSVLTKPFAVQEYLRCIEAALR